MATLQLVTNIFGVIGVLASLYAVALALQHRWRRYYTWSEVENMVKRLAIEIKTTGCSPGLICGTGRGGGIIAALLSYQLGAVPVLVFDRLYLQTEGSLNVETLLAEISLPSEYEYIKEKPTILVTPQSDPGITLSAYAFVLRKNGFQNVRKAALQKSRKSLDKDLDLFVFEYDSVSRVREFPWVKDSIDIMEAEGRHVSFNRGKDHKEIRNNEGG